MDQNEVIKTLYQFKNALESINIRVDKLILFGSYATGFARADSDIDVIVVSASFTNKSYWERINMLTEAVYRIFAPIEATAMTPEEWKNGTSLIADFARKELKVI